MNQGHVSSVDEADQLPGCVHVPARDLQGGSGYDERARLEGAWANQDFLGSVAPAPG